MKKKLIFILLINALVLFTSNVWSQTLHPLIRDKYPHSIAIQVFDIVVKTKTVVVEKDQKAIADLLIEKEEKVFENILENAPDSIVIETKISFDDQINDILDVEQKYNRAISTSKENAKNKYSYSQFSAALRYKDSLQISEIQEASLLSYVDTLKRMKNAYYEKTKKSLDTRAFESQNITTVLTSSQYGKMLMLKNKRRSVSHAENDWKELELRHADSLYAKIQVIKDLTTYYSLKSSIYDMYQHDLIVQKAELRVLYSHRPTILRILEKIRRNPDNDTATKIFKW